MGCLINKGIKQYAVITDFIQKFKKYYKTNLHKTGEVS